jgi:hypothetical protein
MQINERDLPQAGEHFFFSVDGGITPIRIQVFIAGTLHYEGECPDPPCHEMTMIPARSQGSVLRIVTTDKSGARFERSFTIGASGGMPFGGGGTVPQHGGGMTSGASG